MGVGKKQIFRAVCLWPHMRYTGPVLHYCRYIYGHLCVYSFSLSGAVIKRMMVLPCVQSLRSCFLPGRKWTSVEVGFLSKSFILLFIQSYITFSKCYLFFSNVLKTLALCIYTQVVESFSEMFLLDGHLFFLNVNTYFRTFREYSKRMFP